MQPRPLSLCLALAVALLATHTPRAAEACCITGPPSGATEGSILVAARTGVPMSATFCGGAASSEHVGWLVSPLPVVWLGTVTRTDLCATVPIGPFQAGQELLLALDVAGTTWRYFTGPASRNPDGMTHTLGLALDPYAHTGEWGGAAVTFEDTFWTGPAPDSRDFDDYRVIIDGPVHVLAAGEDADRDGIANAFDSCVLTPNTAQADADLDGVGDACDPDLVAGGDGDGVADGADNCPAVHNPFQEDNDRDGVGDVCDACHYDPDHSAPGDACSWPPRALTGGYGGGDLALPDEVCPRWTLQLDGGAAEPTLGGGVQLVTESGAANAYYHQAGTDWAPPRVVRLHAQVQVVGQGSGAIASLVVWPLPGKEIALHLGDGLLWLSDGSLPVAASTADWWHTYDLEIDLLLGGVTLYRDGALVRTGALYDQPAADRARLAFGELSADAWGASQWTAVLHNLHPDGDGDGTVDVCDGCPTVSGETEWYHRFLYPALSAGVWLVHEELFARVATPGPYLDHVVRGGVVIDTFGLTGIGAETAPVVDWRFWVPHDTVQPWFPEVSWTGALTASYHAGAFVGVDGALDYHGGLRTFTVGPSSIEICEHLYGCYEAPIDESTWLPERCVCVDPETDGWCADEDNCADHYNQHQDDRDGDGAGDACDACPDDPAKTDPGVCGCGVGDVDTDGDGTLDCEDGCPSDPGKTAPGGCGCGVADLDTDGDGALDCDDGCPSDPAKTAPGACGCGLADTDADGDGAPDCTDECPGDPFLTCPPRRFVGTALPCAPGTEVVELFMVVTSQNYYLSSVVGKPVYGGVLIDVSNLTGEGAETAPVVNFLLYAPHLNGGYWTPASFGTGAITASYSDGVFQYLTGGVYYRNWNGSVRYSWVMRQDYLAIYPEGIAVYGGALNAGTWLWPRCDCVDGDADGWCDAEDNCPTTADRLRTDTDGDGHGDVCDGCPTDAAKLEPGQCGCGNLETDTDGDGTADCNDGCPTDPAKTAPGLCGCRFVDDPTDGDGDGKADCVDGCPADPALTVPHTRFVGQLAPWAPGTHIVEFFTTVTQNNYWPEMMGKRVYGGVAIDVSHLAGVGVETAPVFDYRLYAPHLDGAAYTPASYPSGSMAAVYSDGVFQHLSGDVYYATWTTHRRWLMSGTTLTINNGGPVTCYAPVNPSIWFGPRCDCVNSDTDGWCDDEDDCPLVANLDQYDTDGDGPGDVCEDCPNDPTKTVPGQCGCGNPDTDTDGDGVADCVDGCVEDPRKTEPGVCGCGIVEDLTDTDGDGTPDCNDGCPENPWVIYPYVELTSGNLPALHGVQILEFSGVVYSVVGWGPSAQVGDPVWGGVAVDTAGLTGVGEEQAPVVDFELYGPHGFWNGTSFPSPAATSDAAVRYVDGVPVTPSGGYHYSLKRSWSATPQLSSGVLFNLGVCISVGGYGCADGYTARSPDGSFVASTCDPPDSDGDGHHDHVDNCVDVSNPGQEDLDADGIGDVCDPDADGDGHDAATDCDDRNAAVWPGQVEACDDVDNDCDPLTADGWDEAWYLAPCDGADADLCSEGELGCVAGAQGCSDTTADTLDGCDGFDNDCDPATADGVHDPLLGAACDGPGDVDLCAEGVYECRAGALSCLDVDALSVALEAQLPSDVVLPAGIELGYAVAVAGDTAVLGAPHDGGDAPFAGAAYVFGRTGASWTLQARLAASDAEEWDRFGSAVAIDGDTIVVGAYGNDDLDYTEPILVAGAAYVFVRSGGTWAEQAKLVPTTTFDTMWFGYAVDVDGDRICVGAPGDDAGANFGSAFVYERAGTAWTQTAALASDPLDGAFFGWSVAVDGDTVVVGAPQGAEELIGAVYVYGPAGAGWTQTARLTASDAARADWFGQSVAVSGGTKIGRAHV